MEGRWAGRTIPPGYMVDERKFLPDGSRNENWRRYVPHDPFAEIVREYFNLFLQYGGNLNRTLRHILEHGPFFPDPKTGQAPDGFRFVPPHNMRHYGRGFCPGETGLKSILTIAAYIGFWLVGEVVVHRSNHPAIIDEKTFMQAFSYLSDVTLDGEPNPHYRAFATRPSRDEHRPVERPLCAGRVFTRVSGRWRKAGTSYNSKHQHYLYTLFDDSPLESMLWARKADYVDMLVIDLFRRKFVETFDPSVWGESIEASA